MGNKPVFKIHNVKFLNKNPEKVHAVIVCEQLSTEGVAFLHCLLREGASHYASHLQDMGLIVNLHLDRKELLYPFTRSCDRLPLVSL